MQLMEEVVSFNEKPKVDKNAKISAQSVSFIKSIFSMNNGFISRDEFPDYGIDLYVELIINSFASGKIFPIQIKSSTNLQVISKDNREYISLEFETSRLGYLCGIPPAYGLIIVYGEKNNIAYFDYVEEIFNRINCQKENDEWKKQESININIPKENILNEMNTNNIFQKFYNRFYNHEILIKSEGLKFGIPNLLFLGNQDKLFDENDPVSIRIFLEKYGYVLSNENHFEILQSLLLKLTRIEINNSSILLFISLLCNYRTGNLIEADYYRKKLNLRINDFSEKEKLVIEFISLFLDFKLGTIDYNEYLNKLVQIESQELGDINKIIVKTEIFFFKTLISRKDIDKLKALINEGLSILDNISESSIDEKMKESNKLSLAQSLFNIAHSIYVHRIGLIKMRSSLYLLTSMKDRLEYFKEFNETYKISMDIIKSSYEFSKKNNDKFIQGISLLKLCYFFFEMETISYHFKTGQFSSKELYEIHYNNAIEAYNAFVLVSLKYEAFQALCISLDILKIYRMIYQSELENSKEKEVIQILESIKKETGLNYIDYFTEFETEEDEGEDKFFSTLSDDDLDEFARDTLDALMLPKERIDNIQDSLKRHRYFFQRRNCSHLELLEDKRHTNSLDTYYKEKILNILKCEINRRQSETFNNIKDIDFILTSFKNDYCKHCQQDNNVEIP
jgi:hypothetical protein